MGHYKAKFVVKGPTLELNPKIHNKSLIYDKTAILHGLVALSFIDSKDGILRKNAINAISSYLNLKRYVEENSHYNNSDIAAASIVKGLRKKRLHFHLVLSAACQQLR